jgi:hypothetical protein
VKRARYRVRQALWHLRRAPLSRAEMEEVRRVLPPALAERFARLSPGEQAHGLRVLRAVAAGAHPYAARPELLQAALLHDLGKSLAPLNLFERTCVVLARRLLPTAAARWSRGPERGWRRAFVAAARHPEWGAELAVRAGAAPLVAALIRRHQAPLAAPRTPEDEMLAVLQAADDDQ